MSELSAPEVKLGSEYPPYEHTHIGEHETHTAVRLANTMSMMELVHKTQTDVANLSKALTDHIAQENEDRKVITEELHNIKIDIQKLDSKIDSVAANNYSDLLHCRGDLRKDMNDEFEANVRSLKMELLREIESIKHHSERFSDHINQHNEQYSADMRRLFERIEAVERNQAANNQWIEFGKRFLYGVAGAIGIAILAVIGVKFK